MNRHLGIFAFTLLLLAGITCMPVYAFNISGIHYSSGVFSEKDDYTLVKAEKAPSFATGIRDTNVLEIDGAQYPLEIRYLVGYPGSSVEVELSNFITSSPVQYESDLEYAQVLLNGQQVSGSTIDGEGTVRIKGNIPYNIGLDKPVSIIRFPEADDAMNTKFILYTTTPERALAKENLFALYEKINSGSLGISKSDLSEAALEYNSGNYITSRIKSEVALRTDRIKQEGILVGILIGAVVAAVLFIAGWYLGKRKGCEIERRPDLLMIEEIINRYFNLIIQKKSDVPKTCKGMLERAFEHNSKRIVTIGEMTKAGHAVNPDELISDDLRPTLFQAFYEKSRYGKSQAFDQGIQKLMECLPLSTDVEKGVVAQRTRRGLFRKH